MQPPPGVPARAGILISMACFVVVVKGIQAASPVLVPFLLSVFIAVAVSPPMFWMEKKKIPTGLAVLAIVLVVLMLFLLLVNIITGAIEEFTRSIPAYQQRMEALVSNVVPLLQGWHIDITSETLLNVLNPGRMMAFLGGLLSRLGGVFTNTFFIVLTVIFILMEASGFSVKLQAALGNGNASHKGFHRITEGIRHYLAIKSATSLTTGGVIYLGLTVFGVDFPAIWGLIAFIFNFVPNIGSIIAAVPAILLATVQLGGMKALMVAILYLITNVTIGNLIEPRVMGSGVGLSALVVFLSLAFWGWVMGPVGMILSVPLTMALKISLEAREETRWIAILLGPEKVARNILKETAQ
ncbi:AI-2E family transporter [Desulfoluna butyratoxydans]|uniref:Transmembrane protein tqsa-like n=1 Tax=Desulfoluna butyratoxydans TaxID=231438 RepID=A0A4U8YMF4_9BACT|nr:AI-2E family transporter [Desulfoluna butyratoxydans]VFQ44704.1 transmembrane protein tqsa-like [Desulfoluna butyratoxydans]